MVLTISYAEKQQEVALETLSSYKLKPQPVLNDDPDLELAPQGGESPSATPAGKPNT
jgi:hypothetical protein